MGNFLSLSGRNGPAKDGIIPVGDKFEGKAEGAQIARPVLAHGDTEQGGDSSLLLAGSLQALVSSCLDCLRLFGPYHAFSFPSFSNELGQSGQPQS